MIEKTRLPMTQADINRMELAIYPLKVGSYQLPEETEEEALERQQHEWNEAREYEEEFEYRRWKEEVGAEGVELDIAMETLRNNETNQQWTSRQILKIKE